MSDISLGTVLITGGCGFLGTHLVSEVLENGNATDVYVVDLHAESTQDTHFDSVIYYTADITQRAHVEEVFRKVKPHTILHCASPPPMVNDPDLFMRVIVEGTRNVIEVAKNVGTVRALVYTSSSSVIHDNVNPLTDATEEMPILYYPQQPIPYSHAKGLAEELALAANRSDASKKMLTCALRPVTIYGEGDRLFTPALVEAARAGRAKTQLGSGRNLFDVVYVGNLADAVVLAAKALIKASSSAPLPAERKVEGEAFIVSNDEHVPFWALNRLAARFAGYPVEDKQVWTIPRWLAMIIGFLLEWVCWIFTMGKRDPTLSRRVVRLVTMDRCFNIEKIKSRLGYRPKVGNEEGMKRSVRWVLENKGADAKKEK